MGSALDSCYKYIRQSDRSDVGLLYLRYIFFPGHPLLGYGYVRH